MRMMKSIPALTLVASLAAGTMLMPVTKDAFAKSIGGYSEFDGTRNHVESADTNRRDWLREARRDHDSDHKHKDEHKEKSKEKSKDKDKDKDKHKHKDTKCGKKKKCPTPKPIIEPIHGGTPPGAPGTPGAPVAGKPGGAPSLGDPGYNAPPAGGSSGGGAASPGGPGRDPVENGPGTTIKPN